MRFFKSKIFAAMVSVTAVTLVLAIVSSFGNNFITNILNTVSSPVQSVFAAVLKPVNEYFTLIDEMEGYKAENDRLIKEITRLKKENRDAESYIAENNRLKNLLDLQQKQINMETVAAEVISRDYEKWYKGISINKGSSDGIKKGDPVMTTDGILGVVDSVGKNWAKIITIFDSRSAVGAKFTRTGDVGVVEGSQELSDLGKCKIEYISGAASVMNGDILVTSGLGEVYPSNLMIGKVSEVKVDAMGKIEYAVVEPAVDFDKVYEVLVITDFTEETQHETAQDDKNSQSDNMENGGTDE